LPFCVLKLQAIAKGTYTTLELMEDTKKSLDALQEQHAADALQTAGHVMLEHAVKCAKETTQPK